MSDSRRPWMIACLSRSSTVSPSLRARLGFALFVRVVLDELLQRIARIVFGEQQSAGKFAALLVDRRERNDLGGVQDRRVEPGFDAVVKKDAVHAPAGSRGSNRS